MESNLSFFIYSMYAIFFGLCMFATYASVHAYVHRRALTSMVETIIFLLVTTVCICVASVVVSYAFAVALGH